ncbi:MAG: hypothetical protein ACE5FN_07050 [Leptospirillia bacterium]
MPIRAGVAVMLALLFCLPAIIMAADSVAAEARIYAIQLQQSERKIEVRDVPGVKVLFGHHLYVLEHQSNGRTGYRLRLGFFPTAAAAGKVQRALLDDFPGAWVTRVDTAERDAGIAEGIVRRAIVAPSITKPPAAEQTFYAIQLRQGPRKMDLTQVPGLKALFGHHLYFSERQTKDGGVDYRLRLGFFSTAAAAGKVQRELLDDFPGAWVTRVDAAERDAGMAGGLVRRAPSTSRTTATPATPPPGTLAVQLRLSERPPNPKALPDLPVLSEYWLYTSETKRKDKTWYQLRLGFFTNSADAAVVRDKLTADFPGAWITRVSSAERAKAASTPMLSVAAKRSSFRVPGVSDERIQELMDQARDTMTSGEYARAVQLYTKVIGYGATPFRQDAQEFLGLARERNGQIAHAKAEYQRYLSEYPEGEGNERVQQRLAGLITARMKVPDRKLRKAKVEPETVNWDLLGGFSQFYRRDERVDEAGEHTITLSTLSSNLDLTGRRRGPGTDLRMRFTGSDRHDFLGSSDSEFRLTNLYLEGGSRATGNSLRVGRQSRSTGGVLGRFDGMLLGLGVGSIGKLNLVGGAPVELSTVNSVHKEKWFYGVSLDLEGLGDRTEGNIFYVQQMVAAIVDRRAVGGEIRYFDSTRSLFSLVDYDVLYNRLNTLLMLGSITLPNKTRLNFNLDLRTSPILTTSNALQGQTALTMEELLRTTSELQARQLAEDRTAKSRAMTMGVSRPISARFQVNGDITVSKISSTPSSGGVPATPATDNEFFYNLQFIGSGLIKEGDTVILGTRYSNTTYTDTITLLANARYPVTREFRLNPRFRFDFRKDNRNDTTRMTARPSIRTEYRWKKRYRFEFEWGGEWTKENLTTGSEDTRAYFLSLGYRIDL